MSKKNIFFSWLHNITEWLLSPSLWTFLMFLVLAAIIWYGHALNTVRERQLIVPITYIGIPENVSTEDPLPDKFYITVRDQGKRLRAYRQNAMVAVSIDLTQQFRADKGTLHINAEQVKQKLSDQLQGTAKIQHIAPEVIQTTYYHQAQKKVKIKTDLDIETISQYKIVDGPTITPRNLMIYGKKEQLDTISQITTQYKKLTNVRDTLITKLCLQPIENVRFAQDSVDLFVVAEQFTEKRLVMPIQTKGVPRSENLRLFPATVEVVMQVKVNKFAQVTDETVSVYCNYPKGNASTLPVEVKYDKSIINSIRIKPDEVEFIIEK
ncbi:MAG: hypothetical protein IJ834_03425 [Paludibacteraceae bacterium]|nr:hypothetical protein [Paludibacteraceae bacterium]